jgi:ketosteroid isomerase-like protein
MSVEANKRVILSFFEHFSAGKVYNNLYHFLVEIREGQIQAVREYLDTMHAKDVLLDQ